MSRVTKENLEILSLDEQGAGRNGAEQQFIQSMLPGKVIRRAGIRPPDSGRKDLHPAVVDSIESRLQIKIPDKKIHLLKPADVTPFTLVVLLTELEFLPPYVLQQAFDVLLAPVADPFPTLEQSLEPAMTQLYFYSYLLMHVIENNFEVLGTERDNNGNVIPRSLSQFQPKDWEPEYSVQHLGNLWSKSSVENRSLTATNPRKSFFDDEWGEPSALTSPGSLLGLRSY